MIWSHYWSHDGIFWKDCRKLLKCIHKQITFVLEQIITENSLEFPIILVLCISFESLFPFGNKFPYIQ